MEPTPRRPNMYTTNPTASAFPPDESAPRRLPLVMRRRGPAASARLTIPDLFSSAPLALSPPPTGLNVPMDAGPSTSRHPASTSGQHPAPPAHVAPTPSSAALHTDTSEDAYFSSWRGRKLRLPGPLPWPCDPLELERTEAQHHLLRLLLGYPFLGPVDEILRSAGTRARVLDIATGAGLWAAEVAEMYPWARVVGCDNAPIMELETWENVEWDIVDLEDLPYSPESFDVVNIRFAKLRVLSYPHLLRSAYSLVRPGGVLLLFDAISPPALSNGKSTTGTQAWSDAFHRSIGLAGLRPFSVDEVVKVFRGEDIVGNDMSVPIGHGQGRLGQLGKIHMINTKAYLDAGRYVMTQHGGYTDAEVDVLTAAYLQDVREHALYTKYHAFTVRKPKNP